MQKNCRMPKMSKISVTQALSLPLESPGRFHQRSLCFSPPAVGSDCLSCFQGMSCQRPAQSQEGPLGVSN